MATLTLFIKELAGMTI